MNVTINGQIEQIPSGLTIVGLLAHKSVEMPDMVSVELNGEILDRPAFDTTLVSEGDSLEFLYFMGGGQ